MISVIYLSGILFPVKDKQQANKKKLRMHVWNAESVHDMSN